MVRRGEASRLTLSSATAPRAMERHGVPRFGERVPGVSYVRRPSAYAIIRSATGEVAVVRTAAGVFLPGGGMEAGESAEQAVVREVLEECGFAIRLLARLPGAVEFLHARAESTYFEKICTFFSAVAEGTQTRSPESDHEVLWLSSDAAAPLLSHESHRWALRSGT